MPVRVIVKLIIVVTMVFRKRPRDFVPHVSSVPISVLQSVEEKRGDQIVKKEVVVDVTPDQYFERNPIPHDDFTLAQELAAGVSVKEISTAGMLDSPDNLDYDVNDVAEDKILSALEKDNK